MARAVACLISTAHVSGAQFLLGDGSCRFFGENLNFDVFQTYGQMNDGTVLSE